MRITAIGLVLLAFIVVGAGVGLLLVENGSGEGAWVAIELHPWLRMILGQEREVWMPALLSGWLVAIVSTGALLMWSLFYVWRRRQYEGLIRKMERELINLRNLPLEAPAPFEDQRERPDEAARTVMLATAGDGDDVDRARAQMVDRGAPFADPRRSAES